MAFLIALAAATGLMPLGAWVGRRLGLVDRPSEDGLKIHRAPVPVSGGLTVLVVVAGVAAVGGSFDPWVAAAVGVGTLGGLVDDVRPVRPSVRLTVQALAGLLLAGAWGPALGPIEVLSVVFLTVACTNAVNITDGQDGLAGGLAAVAAAGLAAVAMLVGTGGAAQLGVVLAGALLGFLFWNRPPARVFLGDGGAYGVGTLLAALAVRVILVGGWPALLAAGSCLGVFAFELIFTVARRFYLRRPITTGDRLHSYDLVAGRLGRGGSTVVFLALGVLAAVLGIAVLVAPVQIGVAILVGAGATVGLGWRWWHGRRRVRDEADSPSGQAVPAGDATGSGAHRQRTRQTQGRRMSP